MKYFIHCGFLNFSGDKMSKSLGNVIRLDNVKYNYIIIFYYDGIFYQNHIGILLIIMKKK